MKPRLLRTHLSKLTRILLALTVCAGICLPAPGVWGNRAYASEGAAATPDTQDYIEQNLDAQKAAIPAPGLFDSLLAFITGKDPSALVDTGHCLYVNYLFVDKSMIDDTDTIDDVWGIDHQGKPVLGQTHAVVSLFDPGDSDYYVAFTNNAQWVNDAKAQDWSFTECNLDGIEVEGPIYDAQTGIAYIPKSLFWKDGQEIFFGIQQQLMIPYDIDEGVKAEVDVQIENSASGVVAVAENDRVSVDAFDVTTTIPVATPETAGTIELSNISVEAQGTQGSFESLVEGENASYDQKTGELTITGNALSCGKLKVTLSNDPPLDRALGVEKAHAAVADDLATIPFWEFKNLNLDSVKVGDIFTYKGNYNYPGLAKGSVRDNINAAISATKSFGYSWTNNTAGSSVAIAENQTYALADWILGGNAFSADRIMEIARNNGTLADASRASVAFTIDLPFNTPIINNIDFSIAANDGAPLYWTVAALCGHNTAALGNPQGTPLTGDEAGALQGTIHMRILAKGDDYVVIGFQSPRVTTWAGIEGQAGSCIYKFKTQGKGSVELQKVSAHPELLPSGSANLGGAKYGIWNDDGSGGGYSEPLATDMTGYARVDNIRAGWCWIHEYEASPGHAVATTGGEKPSWAAKTDFNDSGWHHVYVNPGKVNRVAESVGSVEEPCPTGKIALTKVAFDPNAAEGTKPPSLKGAVYGVWSSEAGAKGLVEANAGAVEGTFFIHPSVNPGFSTDVLDGSQKAGANVRLWEWNGADCQRWTISKNADGTYKVVNVQSGMALDIQGSKAQDGSNIVQNPSDDRASEKWNITQNKDGSCTFAAASNTTQVIDVEDHLGMGQNIDTWSSNGGNNQKWTLKRASGLEGKLVTDEAGKATTSDLLPGKYFVREITAPAGYEKDATIYPVTVTAGKTVAVNDGTVKDTVTPSNPPTPEKPDTPDKPKEPDTPDKPDKPEEPDTPDKPDKPQEPDTPDKPDKPQEPDTPEETPPVPEKPKLGGITVVKLDQATGAVPQGDASLAGAEFAVANSGDAAVTVDGKPYAKGETIMTIKAKSGQLEGKQAVFATTGERKLPLGTYTVTETKAGAGYETNKSYSTVAKIEKDGQTVVLTGDSACKNAPIRGGVSVEKIDADTSSARSAAGATLEGAEFTITLEGSKKAQVNGKVCSPGDAVATIKAVKTEHDGKTAYVAATANDALPFGTYSIAETKAPAGYALNTQFKQTFEVRKGHTVVTVDACTDQIKRGDVRFTKVEEGSNKALAGIVFRITSKTTGESHIAVTNDKGVLDTSAATRPHTANTNGNDKAVSAQGVVTDGMIDRSAGIWFAGTTDKGKPANDKQGALPYDTYTLEELPSKASLGHNVVSFTVTIDSEGTIVDQGKVADKVIDLHTTATGPGDDHLAPALQSVTITDRVEYTNLTPGTTYTLRATAHLRGTDGKDGGALAGPDGKPATATKEFKAEKANGSVKVEMEVCTADIAGKDVVVFEKLLTNGVEMARHESIGDEAQTVHVPAIATTCTGQDGSKTVLAQEKVSLTDTVEYSNLVVGRTYKVTGTLHNKATGKAVQHDGSPVTVTREFTPESSSGTVDITFDFDGQAVVGSTVVAFERIASEGVEYAVHANLNDRGQSVNIPRIATTLSEESGAKDVLATTETKLVDTVAYDHLTPGVTYTVSGTLHVRDDQGEPQQLTDESGAPLVATEEFTPTEEEGTVNVTFTFDATKLQGRNIVAFEEVSVEGTVVARHADIDDEAQTVHVPSIATQASDATTKLQESKAAEKVTITDSVAYTNLTPGVEYTMHGTLMNRWNGEVMTQDGVPVETSVAFTPDKPNGEVKIDFTFDAAKLAGTTVVAFETCSRDGRDVAVHADLSNEPQTVRIPRIGTEAFDAQTRQHETTAAQQTTITDIITYHALTPGKEHTVRGVLMSKETGAPLTSGGQEVRSEAKFTPEAEDGTVELSFTFDSTQLANTTAVAFEAVFLDDVEVAAHADLNDKAQTVIIVEPENPDEPDNPTPENPPTSTPPTPETPTVQAGQPAQPTSAQATSSPVAKALAVTGDLITNPVVIAILALALGLTIWSARKQKATRRDDAIERILRR